jgi:hypothetical protein
MRLPSPALVGLGAIALGKTLNLHLGPLTPLEAAQEYTSSTALGGQIAALNTLYTQLESVSGGSMSDNLTLNTARTTLGNILVALVALDKQLIAYEAQVQAALAAAGKSTTSTDTSATPAACPPGVSPVATGAIAAATAAVGGILGWIGRETFGGKK